MLYQPEIEDAAYAGLLTCCLNFDEGYLRLTDGTHEIVYYDKQEFVDDPDLLDYLLSFVGVRDTRFVYETKWDPDNGDIDDDRDRRP